MMAVSRATLGLSKKTYKAGNRKFAAGVSKLSKEGKMIAEGKAPSVKSDIKGASKFYPKKQVAQARAKNFGPKKIPSVYETGRIRHPQNAWRRPKMPDNSKMPNGPKMLPHQTSNWSKQKSPVSEGNYLAWKYQGFPADKSPFNKGKKGY